MDSGVGEQSRIALQASGMVAMQVGCTPDEGLALIGERAERGGRTVDEYAAAIVERRTRFI